jgi:hypothetical protein
MMIGQSAVERIDVGDRLIVPADDHVSIAQTCAFGWTALLDTGDKNAAGSGKVVAADQNAMKWRILARHTNVATLNFSIFDKAAGNKFGGVDRNGETDALSRKNDGGVDADDFTIRRD